MCSKLAYCNPRIDKCLQELVKQINKESEYTTLSSCCGHGKYDITIVAEHKESGKVIEWFSKVSIQRQVLNRYYEKKGKCLGLMYRLKEYENVIA